MEFKRVNPGQRAEAKELLIKFSQEIEQNKKLASGNQSKKGCPEAFGTK